MDSRVVLEEDCVDGEKNSFWLLKSAKRRSKDL